MSPATPSDNQPEQPPFKEQLNEVAKKARQPSNSRETSNSPSLVKKVAQYVPGAANLLETGNGNQEQRKEAPPKDSTGPPYRPDHDDHISEFIRGQYRSKKIDGSQQT